MCLYAGTALRIPSSGALLYPRFYPFPFSLSFYTTRDMKDRGEAGTRPYNSLSDMEILIDKERERERE